jgi:DNA helicase-2/ATP-dependent DNA helicase PcrA
MVEALSSILPDDLNVEQRAAVEYVVGPMRIIAGAGTGKTRTLTARFVHLVSHHRVPPHEILALTFSSKAAAEMRSRVLGMLPGSYRELHIQTFHSLCLKLMTEWRRERGEPIRQVISDLDRTAFVRRAVASISDEELLAYAGDPGRRKLERDLLTLVDRAKDELQNPADVAYQANLLGDAGLRLGDLATGYAAYQRELARHGARDFGDFAAEVVSALRSDAELHTRTQARFRHILVDEFQDTNYAQFELIRLLLPEGEPLCVVGDSNQAIYGFRGGRSTYMDNFERWFPRAKTFRLTSNYRSRPEILEAANRLIRHDPSGGGLELQSARYDGGAQVTVTHTSGPDREADTIARTIARLVRDSGQPRKFNEIAILFRSIRQTAEPVMRALSAHGIPFSLGPCDLVQVDVMQDILAAMRLITGTVTWADAARLATGRGLPGPVRLDIERVRSVEERDALLFADPAELGEAEGSVVRAAQSIVREASAVGADALPMLLYQAMRLAGVLHDGQDPDTAQLFKTLLDQARVLDAAGASPQDLLTHLSSGLHQRDDEAPDNPSGVQLLTVHAAKGLEWPVVFVTGLAETIFPLPMRLDAQLNVIDLIREHAGVETEWGNSESARETAFRQEERRLAYVAVTRAQHELHLTVPMATMQGPLSPSSFIDEMFAEGAPSLETADGGPVSIADLRRQLRRKQRLALTVPIGDPDEREAIANLLLAQWAATGIVPGAVPLRSRSLPAPNEAATSLRFSFSQLDTYEKCPRQYLYSSVLQLDTDETGPALALGNAVHDALKELNHRWLQRGTPPEAEESDAVLDTVWPAVGFDCRPQSAQLKVRARAMLWRYYQFERDREPARRPVRIEDRISAAYGQHSLSGRVDLVVESPDGHAEIIDFKTGRPDNYKPAESLQLFMYAHGWQQQTEGAHQPTVAYMALRHPEDKAYVTGSSWEQKQYRAIRHTPAQTEQLAARLDGLLTRILANDFAPQPDTNTCLYCRFRWICPEG